MGHAWISPQMLKSPAPAMAAARFALAAVPALLIVEDALRCVHPVEVTVNVTYGAELLQLEALLREGKTRPDIPPGTDVDHETFTFCREEIRLPELIRDGAGRHA